MGQSFRSEVPWKQCYSWWGANEDCYVRESNSVSLISYDAKAKVTT